MPLMPGAERASFEGGPLGALVLHGFCSTPQSVRAWGEHLAAAGLSVEVPRLPGHGTRWEDMNVTRWDDWFSEVDRSLGVLRERCDRVVVMGLSMGGSLALRAAQTRPEDVAGLVLVNPAVHTERRDAFLLPVLRHLVPSFPGIIGDIRMPGAVELGYDRIPLQAAYSLQHDGWAAVRRDIARVTAPILMLRSRVDHVVEPSNGDWILDNVASRDVTVQWLERSYHVATLDEDAPLIHDASLEFAHRVAAPTAQA